MLKQIQDYIVSDYTDRAILISGAWGTGKTFFWHKKVAPFIRKNKLIPIYITLNGISRVEQLEFQFNTSGMKWLFDLENKSPINLWVILRSFFKLKFEEIFSGKRQVSNIHKFVICFDDLERSKLDIEELWSFINYYIEHFKCKTIIIANESKIDNDIHFKIREKSVFRVIKFQLEFNSVIDEIFTFYEHTNKQFFDFLKKHKEFILKLIENYNIQNLRTLKLFVENLRTIFNYSASEDSYYSKIILFTLILTNEFCDGNISLDENKRYHGLDTIGTDTAILSSVRRENPDNVQEQKTYSEEFYEKYLLLRLSDYKFYPSIYNYIIHGLFNEQEFTNDINKNKTHVIKESDSAYSKLITAYFRILDDKEFKELFEKTLLFSEKGEYSMYKYVKIADTFSYFKEENLIDVDSNVLQNKLISGVRKASEKSQYSNYMLEEIKAFSIRSDTAKRIYEELKLMHNSLEYKEYEVTQKLLIEIINNGDREQLSKIFTKNEGKPFLILGYPENLLKALLGSNNQLIYDFQLLLNRRYKFVINEVFYKEIEFLRRFEKGLKESLDSIDIKEFPITRHNLSLLIQVVNEQIRNLELNVRFVSK